ncbi:hypothetical protein K474DRAFT_1680996 [Panus rudis PR-1116 ss-1]|nr:hypothetical protein K474DRAFT_1680996 [Panus rudis PR-1116 ss-1]
MWERRSTTVTHIKCKEVREGAVAYARKQAALYRRLEAHCQSIWSKPIRTLKKSDENQDEGDNDDEGLIHSTLCDSDDDNEDDIAGEDESESEAEDEEADANGNEDEDEDE